MEGSAIHTGVNLVILAVGLTLTIVGVFLFFRDILHQKVTESSTQTMSGTGILGGFMTVMGVGLIIYG